MSFRTLYLFASAAPPVLDVAHVIEDAQSDGWEVCLGLTPTAARWLGEHLDGLAALTGHPVLWRERVPGEPEVWPAPDVVMVAPATFDTINRWALGVTDQFVVDFAAEAIGRGVPLVTVPCVNAALARHPQFDRSLETLRGAGVTVLSGEPSLLAEDRAQAGLPAYPWHAALDAARQHLEPAS